MYEDAQEIFDYLPIRRNEAENEYLNQLRDTFELLEKSGRLWEKDSNGFAVTDTKLISARAFALLPFHLLFMMALQFMVLRIADIHKDATNLFFSSDGGRYKDKLISEKRAVFDLSVIKERTLPEIFQLVGLSENIIKEIKSLIDKRNNNLAHANGNSTSIDVENSVNDYLDLMGTIQKSFLQINQKLVDEWLFEIKEGDDLGEYIESHLLDSRLSPRDFGDVVGTLLEAEQLDFDQWEQVVNKGLELAYDQTIFALHEIAKNETDDGRRYNAIRVLHENGEIDEEMIKSIIENEKDEAILELLKN
jgi:hypothetical protein